MRIWAEWTVDNWKFQRTEGSAESKVNEIKDTLASSVYPKLIKDIPLQATGNGDKTTFRLEFVVISKKQFERIGELMDYDPYQDNQFEAERRLDEISSILLRDNLE